MLEVITRKITDKRRYFDWNKDFEAYRCSACGWICSAKPKGSIGTAHAHAEKHTGFFSTANPDKLDQFIHKIKVTDFEEVDA